MLTWKAPRIEQPPERLPDAESSVGWKCAANPRAVEPQDCEWPTCGCDPHVADLIETLANAGYVIVPKEPVNFTVKEPHDLKSTLATMRSAKEKGVGMSIWDRDIKAVEDAIETIEAVRSLQRI